MDTNFLTRLSQRLGRTASSTSETCSPGDIYFLISREADGSARISIIDGDHKQVSLPDYRNYSGPVAQMLRALSLIARESRFEITWGEQAHDTFNLSTHPMLIYQLIRCENIVTSDTYRPVAVHDTPALLTLNLEPAGENLPDHTRAYWSLDVPVADGGYQPHIHNRFLLTDSFALCSTGIYPVDPVGDNYRELEFFESTFPSAMTENYLSVVYSYLDHFALNYDGRTVRILAEPVEMLPALSFERIDPDMALHLRVTSSLRGVDEMFLRRFDLSSVVSLSKEGQVSVRRVRPRDHKKDLRAVRDLIVTYAPTRRKGNEVYLDEDTFIIPSEIASPFLLKGLPRLINDYVLLGTDRLKEYKVAPFKPRLNYKLTSNPSGIDFLEGDFSVQLGTEKFNLGKLFEQYRRDKYITLRDGTRAVLDESYMRRLERLFGDKRTSGKKVRISYFDLPDIEELLTDRLDPSLFRHQRKLYEGLNSLKSSPIVIPPGLKATLRNYQKDGVKWIKYLYENNMGGCLADDMGLGKTLQTITVLAGIYPAQPKSTLIVVPRSLVFNWQKEIERFAPWLTTYIYYQTTRDIDEALKANVILTTYAMVRNDIDKFSAHEFHYIILDESQNIKNVTAQTTRAVYLLKGEHRLALSGTPIENNLTELFSLFRFLNPGMLGDLEDFNRRYCNPIQRDDDRDAMNSLRRRIYPFMLRRLKKDVLTELPDRTDKRLYVEMERAQAEYYDQRRRYYKEKIESSIASDGVAKSQFVMLQALSELRRIASIPESLTDGEVHSAKLDMLFESFDEAVAGGHKCVVFFNFIAGLEMAAEHLAAIGIGYETMTGATGDRRRVVERFDRDPECMVLLMTLKTGGVGLNLTVADTVFIFEPWWNKAAEEQAINRLHRFGQKAKVLSYSLIARGTIEEKILELQEKKTALYEELISTDGTMPKHLSAEDIDFLLQ